MKKSRKQRKIETAKRIAKEEQHRKTAKKNFICNLDEISQAVKKMSLNDVMKIYQHDEAHICKPEHYVVKAAILDNATGEIFSRDLATYHCDIRSEFNIMESDDNFTFGFLDNKGGFLTRSEAGEVAYQAGQCDNYYRNSLQSNGYRHIL